MAHFLLSFLQGHTKFHLLIADYPALLIPTKTEIQTFHLALFPNSFGFFLSIIGAST